MTKILIISPTPTHPCDAGNRKHILSIATLLSKNDFDVHMLYLAYEDFDRTAMQSFWGEKLTIIEKDKLYSRGNLHTYFSKKIVEKAKYFLRLLQLKNKRITKEQFSYNAEVDHFFPLSSKNVIRQLQKKHSFPVVVCEYVSMSAALNFFDKNVFKILDTHDKFTDRFEVYLSNTLKPEWISLYKDQEAKALGRSNLILALQDKEKHYFESITEVPVQNIFTVPMVTPLPSKAFEQKLMYFASGNKINIATLQYFEETIFPAILTKHPQVKLLVGGSICKIYKTSSSSHIIMLGTFEDPRDFYCQGDIFINPELDGTGFKIKTLEALSFGLPVVTTKAGASGVEEPFNDHILIAKDIQEFTSKILTVVENETLRKQLKEKAAQWVLDRTEKSASELIKKIKLKVKSIHA